MRSVTSWGYLEGWNCRRCLETGGNTSRNGSRELWDKGKRFIANSVAEPEACQIVVHNKYQWIWDPRLGRFAVYVDGRLSGFAPLDDSLTVVVLPGPHVVRVRAWWFMSPRVNVEASPSTRVELNADISRCDAPFRRVARAWFMPWKALSLERV